jgi:hypothetical protein
MRKDQFVRGFYCVSQFSNIQEGTELTQWSPGMSINNGPALHRIYDVQAGSYATLIPHNDGWQVQQTGPQNIWDTIENALTDWQTAGAPPTEQFRIHATAEEHTIWLPGHKTLTWTLPSS